MGDVGLVKGGGEFRGFGAGIENDALGGEVEDVFDHRGRTLRADVEGEGVDGIFYYGEGFGDGEAFDFFERGIDRDDAVAGVAQAADGHVRVAFRIIAGAEDGNGLGSAH